MVSMSLTMKRENYPFFYFMQFLGICQVYLTANNIY